MDSPLDRISRGIDPESIVWRGEKKSPSTREKELGAELILRPFGEPAGHAHDAFREAGEQKVTAAGRSARLLRDFLSRNSRKGLDSFACRLYGHAATSQDKATKSETYVAPGYGAVW